MRIVTFRQLLEAMRLNGYPQHTKSLFKTFNRDDTGKFTLNAACAYGQAVLNLDVNASPKLRSALPTGYAGTGDIPYSDRDFVQDRLIEITFRNDNEGKTCVEIADELEILWGGKGYLDLELEFGNGFYALDFANYQGAKL